MCVHAGACACVGMAGNEPSVQGPVQRGIWTLSWKGRGNHWCVVRRKWQDLIYVLEAFPDKGTVENDPRDLRKTMEDHEKISLNPDGK